MTDRLAAAVAELVAALDEVARREAGAPPTMPDRLLSVLAAADALGIGRTACYQLIQSGRLRSILIGRRRLVPSGALADFIRAQASR